MRASLSFFGKWTIDAWNKFWSHPKIFLFASVIGLHLPKIDPNLTSFGTNTLHYIKSFFNDIGGWDQVTHVLGVLEWFYMLNEKYFSKIEVRLFTSLREPPVWQKATLFPNFFWAPFPNWPCWSFYQMVTINALHLFAIRQVILCTIICWYLSAVVVCQLLIMWANYGKWATVNQLQVIDNNALLQKLLWMQWNLKAFSLVLDCLKMGL